MSRPSVISCAVFGGRSPKTGLPVGARHRWSGGSWGKGPCAFCGRYLEDVLERPSVKTGSREHLARALRTGD